MVYKNTVRQVLVIVIFEAFQIAHSLTISGSGNYSIPNTCYQLTCSYQNIEFKNDRSTQYRILNEKKDEIASFPVRYLNSTGQCFTRNPKLVPCTADVCSCDQDGMATHFCYNHTEDVTGILLILCYSGVDSNVLRIQVAEGPGDSVNFYPPSTTAVKLLGQPLNPINCTATCYPECHYQWTTETGKVINGSILEIQSLNENDDGIYRCRAWNSLFTSGTTKDFNLTVNYGPQNVTLMPNKTEYNITEGNTFGPVICTAKCRPPCTYSWSGSNISDDTTNNLTLTKVQRNQKGMFYCNSSNPYTSEISSSVIVDVQYGPGTSMKLSSNSPVNTIEGQHLGPIKCSAICNPLCQFKWTLPDKSSFNGQELFIRNVTLTDHGNHTCTAGNFIGDDESTDLQVIVNYGPENVVLTPPNLIYHVTENDKFGPVNCNASCRPPCDFKWFGQNYHSKTDTLNIETIKRNQTGYYYCTSSNPYTSETMQSSNIQVDVQYGPGSSITFSPNDTIVIKKKGQALGPVTCAAICNPFCNYTWTKPDKTIKSGKELYIPNLKLLHHGEFTCTAGNVIKDDRTKGINVTVNYGPEKVILIPKIMKYTVTENGKVGPVSCSSPCRPVCTIKWSGQNYDSTANTLWIQNVTRNQTGDYYCSSTNPYTNMIMKSTNIEIDVHYSAEVTDLNTNSSNMVVSENTTVVFFCMYGGNPFPRITWSFNGHVIASQEVLRIQDQSIFSISSAKCQNIGNYTCFAENSIGNSSKEYAFYVNCPPRSLNDLQTSVAIKNKTSALNLTVAFISFPKPTDIKWYFSKNKTAIREDISDKLIFYTYHNIYHHTTELNNEELTNADYGYYTVEITNGIGNAFHHTFEVIPETVPDMPYNVTASCEDSPLSTIIRWRAGFNGGQDQTFSVWFRIYTRNSHVFVKYPETKLDPGRGELQLITVLNLHPATAYVFNVNASNINGHSLSKDVFCNTTIASLRKDSNSSVIGAAAGATSAIIVLIVVIVVVVMCRKLHQGKDTKDKNCLTEREGDSLEELPDNPDYISADSVTYSEVQKGKKCKEKTDLELQYEDVKLPGPQCSQSINENNSGAEYAAVIKKKTTGKEHSNQLNKKKTKKKKGEDDSGNLELGDIYMNTENTTEEDMLADVYANTDSTDNGTRYKPKKNKDGLIYADLDLAPTPKGKKFIIRGLENRSNYAIIDLTKSAEPLPSDDEEGDEKGEDEQNNEVKDINNR